MKVKKAGKVIFFFSAVFFIAVVLILSIQISRSRDLYTNQQVGKTDNGQNISAIILPHFDEFKTERQKMLGDLKAKIDPEKIFIVSVNHFGAGQKDILLTKKVWEFSGGMPKINGGLAEELLRNKNIGEDDNAFESEHGIKNVLPDLFQSFPQAEFLPIIIKDTAEQEAVDELASDLNRGCPDCLLVASIDFSHYNPDSLAQIHDEMSLAALENLDEKRAWSAETDSPQTMYLATKWAKLHDTRKFSLDFHSNSGEKSKSPDTETTSVVLGYFSDKPAEKPEKATTFVLAGDAMFDRLVYHNFRYKGLDGIFEKFGNRVFWGADLAMLNLEGPISEDPISDDISPNNLSFNFPPGTAEVLKGIHVNTVTLANNHTSNAGSAGFTSTRKLLDQSAIKYVGLPEKITDANVIRIDGDVPTSVIALNVLSAGGSIKKYIETEKSAGRFVIVYPHWGNEYQTKHSASQAELAHQWIDQGADMIVGSHPHVVQDFEIYKGKPIVYSLGNFVFDQTFSRETQQGLIIAGAIREKSVELTFLPTKQVDLMPELVRGAAKSDVVNKLLQGVSGFEKIRSDTIKIGL